MRKRKLPVEFDRERKQIFLDHFAATCNLEASAVEAGISLSPVYRALKTDPAFLEGFEEALQLGYLCMEAEALREQREAQQAYRLNPDDAAAKAHSFERTMQLLREYKRAAGGKVGRRADRSRGRWTFDATIDEIEKKLKAFGVEIPSLPDHEAQGPLSARRMVPLPVPGRIRTAEPMLEQRWRAVLAALKGMEARSDGDGCLALPPPALRSLDEEWRWQAHGGQREPRRRLAGVADHGRARLRQDPGRGRMGVGAGAGESGGADRAGRREPRRGGAGDDRGRERPAPVRALRRGCGLASVARRDPGFPRARSGRPFRAAIRAGCAGRSIISPGATSLRNGVGRRRHGTI